MAYQRHFVTGIIACLAAIAALVASVLIFPLTRLLPDEISLPLFFRLGSTVVVGGMVALLMGMVGVTGPRRSLHIFAIRCGAIALVLLPLLYIVFTTLL